jgi:hypothetical protein
MTHDPHASQREHIRSLRESAAKSRDVAESLRLYDSANALEKEIDARLRRQNGEVQS